MSVAGSLTVGRHPCQEKTDPPCRWRRRLFPSRPNCPGGPFRMFDWQTLRLARVAGSFVALIEVETMEFPHGARISAHPPQFRTRRRLAPSYAAEVVVAWMQNDQSTQPA